MKNTIAAVILAALLLASASAKDKNINPADFPEKGHVVSALHTHHPTSSYDSQNGHYSFGEDSSRTTEIQIGSLVYITRRMCKEAQVGFDYPAKHEKNQIELLVRDNKVCSYRVEGEREAK